MRPQGLAALAAAFLLPVCSLFAAFGSSDDGTNYVVDTGANLIFKVNKSNGDLTSLVYRGVEYQGYAGKNSHVESGLGASTVSLVNYGTIIKITVVHGTLTHYYVARSGENNIYLFTNKTDDTVAAGRYVVRIKPGLFPNTGSDAWDESTYSLIEAGDIWKAPAGTTHSKHHSGVRTMDYDYIGKTTNSGAVGLWVVRSNREKASGGPFYRCLVKGSTPAAQDFYEILHYSMAQSDVLRFGLHGPYILAFTDGGAPASSLYAKNINPNWIDALGLVNWVPRSQRGTVSGAGIGGRDGNYTYTIGFNNATAQYWAAGQAGGAFVCYNMIPGTYTMTVYKGELAVNTRTVTVTAGQTTTIPSFTITADPAATTSIWRLGKWDGTPLEFRNGPLMTYAHPSDSRAASWTSNYIVGTSAATDWPCYQWIGVNNARVIYFKLTAAQIAAAKTLRIGITVAYAGARPQIKVNNWTSSSPSASTQASSRNLTVGTYRGNNATYTYTIPASAFLTDTTQYNVLTVTAISGSTGTTYLSPGYSYDCIDLY